MASAFSSKMPTSMRIRTHSSCQLCQKRVDVIDYKDVPQLKRFTHSGGMILPARSTGMCHYHQQRLGVAIKRARFMALLPMV